MVVGESDFRHHVEDDIRPFRDVLLGLFFVTVGMEVNPTIVMVAPMAVFAWLIVLLPGKAAIALLVGTIMRWPMSVGARVAVILAHGGEFGLLLLTEGVHAGAIGVEVAHPALLSLAITMALGPMLIQRNARLAALISSAARRRRAAAEQEIIEAGHGLDRHIVLCGCGRVGHLVALVLETANLPYIAIESDLGRFRRAKKLGHKVIFDASRKRVLDAAGVSRARVIVITFDRRHVVEHILHNARQANPHISSIISADDDQEAMALAEAGAGTVFPENFAAGLALGDQVLLLCGYTQENAADVVAKVRAELNPDLIGRVGI